MADMVPAVPIPGSGSNEQWQPPPKPLRPPREYVRGDWPDGPVQHVVDSEGGAAVEFMVEQMARVARQLAHRRRERGLRRNQVAKMTGLRPNTVGDVEDGRRWPDMRTITLLVWVLDMDIELEPRVNLRARSPR
jgi:DNA-binding XRE family transcriptional regulator